MFLLMPIKTDSRLQSVPWANWLLIAANCIMFLVEASSQPGTYGRWALNSQRPEIHQFVSYAFLHGGVAHLVGNMIFLYIFGNNICDRLGNISYLAFYLAGAVFSGIGYVAMNQTGMVVGASGAVAAITGAYLALLPKSHITLFYWIFIMIGLYEIPSLWWILAFFVKDVLGSLQESQVAHIAHVTGSIFGFLVCMLLLKTKVLARDQFDMLALMDRWNRRRQYQAVIRKGYDPFGHIPPSQPGARQAAATAMDEIQDLRAQVSEAMAHGHLANAGSLYAQLRKRDPNQTMSRGTQLDLANHYYGTGDYQAAADAYELFLKSYGTSEQAGQVSLMLGLAYGRYLGQRGRAVENLRRAVQLLQFSREHELAKAELDRMETAT